MYLDCSSRTSGTNMKNNESYHSDENSSSGPTVLFIWIWNWFTSLPKTITNLYADIKSGELLQKFTLLDAMGQFILAVATSCHPQEEPEEDTKLKNDTSSNLGKDIKVFGGTGRTLRSRTVPDTS